ncbi:uncharacterized protein LOC129584781 [Paramacrobiotus metropolitanus]|uniref:uncharacterized protein LOC129584781 n=1 Tax=Paramacrobiotus metropolitanus TaxID=2943436 RepID=UPI00244564F9|nr:uncharacterized protein LOC129584781 [Paramacrobiotus metropolitanus]
MPRKNSWFKYVRLNVMKIMGGCHTTFGSIIILLQCASEIISWIFHDHNLFENHFKPGIWLGTPILILGIACLVQHKLHNPKLHRFIVVFTVVVFMICVTFMAIKVRYSLHDPELSTFEDCQSPKWPAAFILDMAPHCNALRMNNSVGQMMLAFASAVIIVGITGTVIAQHFDYGPVPVSSRTTSPSSQLSPRSSISSRNGNGTLL